MQRHCTERESCVDDDVYHGIKTCTVRAKEFVDEEEHSATTLESENPLNTAGFLSVATLWWLHPLLKRGFDSPLDEESVWDLPTADQVNFLQEKFDAAYAKENERLFRQKETTESPNVNFIIWECVKRTWCISLGCHLTHVSLMLLQAFLIKAILKSINDEATGFGISSGYILACLLGCVAFCRATAAGAGQFLTSRIACNAQMLVINNAFRKILRLSATARRTMNTGEIVTFVSVDSQRILQAYKLGMWCVVLPVMLITVSVLIGTEMGIKVGVAAAATKVVILYGSLLTSKKIAAYRRHISRISADRLKLTNEMLQGIRVVKFYGWEGFANKLIRDIRNEEVGLMRKYNRLRLANTVLVYLGPALLNMVCFSATILLGNHLDVPTTFVIVALTNACQTPFVIFADASNAVAEAFISSKRLSGFLAAEETIMSSPQTDHDRSPLISIEGADFQWNKDALTPTLSNVNLMLQPGMLTVVVGPVGSGKSSLVNAILGEMHEVCGTRTVHGRIAYASQQAWIQNQTIRDNILFGEQYDEIHYQHVIKACQLVPDFETLEQGDQTEIGERGINLSGGQKARVGVARAMYRARNFDFIVLDDPLSALDVHVANAVFRSGVMGIANGITRLLVMNSHYHLLQHADRILVMSGGQIVGDGTFKQLKREFPFLAVDYGRNQCEMKTNNLHDDNIKAMEKEILTNRKSSLVVVEPKKLVLAEDRFVGSVRLQTYIQYLSSSGWSGRVLFSSIFILFTIAQVALFCCDWFLSQWSHGSINLSQTTSLTIYVGIVFAAAFLVLVRCLFFMEICMKCSSKIHFKHLHKVVVAPITTFFDVTPTGRILNRFSRDLDEVDNLLPYQGLLLLLCMFQVASSFIVCAAVNVYILVVYVPVIYACTLAARVYQSSARELKRLDSVTRSPFVNLVSETITGMETVRAYDMVKPFAARCEMLLNNNGKFLFHYQSSSRWFDMRTDWTVSLIIMAVAILVVLFQSSLGAALSGLSLTYAAQLSSFFQRMTTLTTQVENIMTCFERIAHYDSLDEEGYKRTPTNKDTLATNWPRTGNVVFENVSMRYRDDLPLVLKHVSFSALSGEKIGICGRTGSGKSSLMSVLFRVVEIPTTGRVLIDGVDIATITVHQLRSKLTIIPQDPMLFSGSLRMNLDPFAEKSDSELYEVLRKVHLSETVSSWGKGLDYEVAEKGENLSVGQRQLLCIARALIRDSKVIVMDEATANVDQESDKLIQQTMKESFGGGESTVLCIAHRIETIMDSDKILVLDAGEVVEFDCPSALLERKSGVFKTLVESSKAVEMIG
ncbi:Multidrug resistance protein ABC Superfamily [Phytophthora palmivora]|uniref:Multidrug resistance protein ABC Superfamily n=1 Tax=Phytophthora palmivora TaxID=4796 RepID=A0A2P4WZV6_9STRA|nr:Multidrug resistance protein ABC Superfamily [Phytophthora palmivora]